MRQHSSETRPCIIHMSECAPGGMDTAVYFSPIVYIGSHRAAAGSIAASGSPARSPAAAAAAGAAVC